MTTKQTLSAEDAEKAKALFVEFWKMFPTQSNPTDINTSEKAQFLILKGFESIRLMQAARKQGYDFTKK